jgi:hypothetical protein
VTTRSPATRTGRFPRPARALALRVLVAATTVAATSVAVAGTASAVPAPSALVAGTPCAATARACVDLPAQKAWLLRDGKILRGPVRISSGGPGKETPPGRFVVQWKNKNHRSSEAGNAPMPYSVFFAEGGIAFHGGDPQRASAGCIHLDLPDAVAWYNELRLGDQVQVSSLRAPNAQRAARQRPGDTARARVTPAGQPPRADSGAPAGS